MHLTPESLHLRPSLKTTRITDTHTCLLVIHSLAKYCVLSLGIKIKYYTILNVREKGRQQSIMQALEPIRMDWAGMKEVSLLCYSIC